MNTPLVTALAAALFHFMWEGAALALLLALALAVFRGSKIRYAFACAALLAMPAAFVVTAALLYPRTLTFPHSAHWPAPAAALFSPVPAASGAPSLLSRLQDSMRWFVPVWFSGIVLLYLRSAGGWIGVIRLRRAGVTKAPPAWQQRVAELAARLRMNRAVTLLESCMIDVPVVAGFLRPVILVPAGFLAGMPAEQLEYLLIHELAHVRRLDYFVNLLQSAIEGMLFYHPAVWWVSQVMERERENCCDDVVLSIHPEPRRYASALAALEQSRWAALPAANGGSLAQRIRRILNRPGNSHVAPTPVLAALMLAISAAVAFAALQATPATRQLPPFKAPPAIPARMPLAAAQSQQQPDPAAAVAPYRKWLNKDVANIITEEERHAFNNLRARMAFAAAQSRQQPTPAPISVPYRKWLNEDVTYIITDEERRAFNNLQDDEEREHFIAQFWERRDPTPGTPENEFKEEHYRRINRVNGQFGWSGIPGWKTDRGRIYITFGPPDEIDSHPSCSAAAPAHDDWMYRFIEGIGNHVRIEFSDPSCSGEYRMTRDPHELGALVSETNGVLATINRAGDLAISVPLDPARSYSVFKRVVTMSGKPVQAAEHLIAYQTLEQSEFRLPPGRYHVSVIWKALGEPAIPPQTTELDIDVPSRPPLM